MCDGCQKPDVYTSPLVWFRFFRFVALHFPPAPLLFRERFLLFLAPFRLFGPLRDCIRRSLSSGERLSARSMIFADRRSRPTKNGRAYSSSYGRVFVLQKMDVILASSHVARWASYSSLSWTESWSSIYSSQYCCTLVQVHPFPLLRQGQQSFMARFF